MSAVGRPGMGVSAVMDVADRFADAFLRGDVQALGHVYATDLCFVAHTAGGEARDRDAALAAFAAIRPHLRGVSLEIVDRVATERGYVTQQVVGFESPDGARLTVAMCLVVRVRDDRITRIDEYLDPTALAPLLGQLGHAPTGPPA